MHHSPPIISLENITASIAAGIRGKGFCTYRQLDGLSLAVFSGDLILLRGGRRHGSHALLQILAGASPLPYQCNGQRRACRAIVVQRGVIPVHIVPDLIATWGEQSPVRHHERWKSISTNSAPAILTLFRSSRQQGMVNRHACRRWSRQMSQRSAALVIAEREEGDLQEVITPRDNANGTTYARQSLTQVREGTVMCTCERSHIRVVHLGFGRIQSDQRSSVVCAWCQQRFSRAM